MGLPIFNSCIDVSPRVECRMRYTISFSSNVRNRVWSNCDKTFMQLFSVDLWSVSYVDASKPSLLKLHGQTDRRMDKPITAHAHG